MKTKMMELVNEVTKRKGSCVVVIDAGAHHGSAAVGKVIDIAATLAEAMDKEPQLVGIFKAAIEAYEHLCKNPQ